MDNYKAYDSYTLNNFNKLINIEILPPLETNCYYFTVENNIIIVDPASKSEKIIEFIYNNKEKNKYIILTHNHIDHINGTHFIKENFNDFKVIMHENDAQNYFDTYINGASFLGIEYKNFNIDINLNNNYLYHDEIVEKVSKKFPLIKFYKIKELEHILFFTTPGHTPGSISFIYKNLLFTGDTLFQNGWGRTDLAGGDENRIKESISLYYEIKKHYLINYSENSNPSIDLIILSGHGDPTTLEDEREFLKDYLGLNL